MKKRIVITVDGLAGSGKTTLAKLLAEKLGYVHFSSGMLYRSVGYLALKYGVELQSEEAVSKLLPQHTISLMLGEGRSSRVLIDGEDVTSKLYKPEVSEATSIASSYASVRNGLVDVQRHAYEGENMVAEGRDMGTVIFNDAPCKFFIEADVNVRVERRLKQLTERKPLSEQERNTLKKQMEIEVLQRDERDTQRGVAPTRAADDAEVILNSSQPLTHVIQSMYDFVAQKGLIRG